MADHIDQERDGGSAREFNGHRTFHNSAHVPKDKKVRKVRKPAIKEKRS